MGDESARMPPPSTPIYRQLDTETQEIRLLQLLPGSDPHALLHGHLQTVPLSEAPQFQSLSYVWGQNFDDNEPLELGGQTLRITSNLANALRAVRQSDVAITLWCDRVCINQDDLRERNHQVRLMRQIFTTAYLVNIWLGPAFPGAAEAFDTLRELATAVKHVENVTKVFQYPWWQQLWILQEGLLANQALVHSGSYIIDLETIMQVFELVWNQVVQHPEPLYQLCGPDTAQNLVRQLEMTIRRLHVTRSLVLIRENGKERRFRDDLSKWPFCMHTSAWSSATDPRDKVYGTLGLFSSTFLDVDYSLSLNQTYIRSTLAIMKRLDNLAVLTQAESQVSIDNGLPSWVPDWRHPVKRTASLLVFYNYFRAGNDMPLNASLLEDKTLQLSARCIDEVAEIGAMYDDHGIELISELSPLIRPIIEDWIRLGKVPETSSGQYCLQLTESVSRPPASTYRTLDVSQRVTAGTFVENNPAYQCQQSYRAPIYKDQSYSRLDQNRGTKRKAIEHPVYAPAQSQSAPLYKDASYHPSATATANTNVAAASGPRIYDPFSHTYGTPTMSPPAERVVNQLHSREQGETAIDGKSSSEMFWRTLSMDIVEDPDLKKHRRCQSKDSWRVWQWVDWLLGRSASSKAIPQLHWHLNTHLQGKRMIRTKSGYIGLAGMHAQVGDEIWVLAGGAYPFVLRSAVDVPDSRDYRMVSHAYIHGCLDGETLRKDVSTIRIS